MKKSTAIEIIAVLFVVLFLYTGVSKLMDYTVFKEQIAVSSVLKPVAHWIAWILPITELVVAILLFIPGTRLKGLYASLGLMVIFTGYVGAILILDDHLPCSCGGVIEMLSWKGHLIFNSIGIGLALAALLLERMRQKAIPLNSTLSYH